MKRSWISAGVSGMLVAAAWGASAFESSLGPLNIDTPPLTPAEAKALHNPVPNTAKSIARGKLLFNIQGCIACHGDDGKAQIDAVANATDLTNPKVYKNGTEPGQMFHSIRDGAGIQMPAFKGQITEEVDVWNLVNFVRNLWPADQRPPVAAE